MSVTQTCPNVSDTHLILLRYEQRKEQEVNDFGESTSGKSSALGMVPGDGTEVLQRCGEYTYGQGKLRGRVGKERGGKKMDRCLDQFSQIKALSSSLNSLTSSTNC
jgi:hypothetical protein